MTKEILNKANELIEEHDDIERIRAKERNLSSHLSSHSQPLQRFSLDTNYGSISIDPYKYPELVASLLSRVKDFAVVRSAELEAEFAALQ